MKIRAQLLLFFFALLALPSAACMWVRNIVLPETPQTTPVLAPGTGTTSSPETNPEPTSSLGPITFCKDVTDDGECIQPANWFPSGTNLVWALFPYQGMHDGQSWGRVWTQDSEIYLDARGESWEEGESGWLAYSISAEDVPLKGNFTLELYLGSEAVQEASFEVEYQPPENLEEAAVFGQIQFSAGVTEDNIPIDPASRFDFGISQVYACFAYTHIPEGQPWSYEWIYKGEVLAVEQRLWDSEPDGLTYLFLSAENALDYGQYTFNLYLDGELERSGGFEIARASSKLEGTGSSDPKDLIDPDLMPAWEMLRDSELEILYRLADLVTDYQVELRLVDTLEHAVAVYSYDANTCEIEEKGAREAGDVLVSQEYWNEHTWEEVAAAVAHELTHAFQHLYTGYRCGDCSVQKEYEAFHVEIYALEEMGRMDLVEEDFPGLVNENGDIDQDLLWDVVKDTYSECPEY